MQTVVGWHVEIEFDEDDTRPRRPCCCGYRMVWSCGPAGTPSGTPLTSPQPRIGEEIAAARALSDLTHQLLDKAADEISEVTHRPATITA